MRILSHFPEHIFYWKFHCDCYKWPIQKQPSRDLPKKRVSKICNKFTGEHPSRSGISIRLQYNFIEIALRHGCSTVNLLHIFRTPFLKKTSARLQPSSGWTFLGLFTDGEGGGVWGVKRSHLPKICHIYLAITKLDTVTPYLKKIQKLYESRDTWVLLAPAFFHRKSANFAISKNTDILAFWYLISTSFTFLSLQRLFK